MWIQFINKVTPPLSPPIGFYHGAQSMFVDAIGCGGCGLTERREGQQRCEAFLRELVTEFSDHSDRAIEIKEDCFGIYPFFIEKGETCSLS